MAASSNPELVRHLRIELRPARVAGAVGVTALLCALAVLTGAMQESGLAAAARGIYIVMLASQFILLAVWAAGSCGDTLVRERAEKTFDFWRTTRLTVPEMILGVVVGRPIVVVVAVACSLPVSIALAILGGVPMRVWLLSYALLPVTWGFCGLLGLWVALPGERAGGGAWAGLSVLGLLWLSSMLFASPWPGLAAGGIWPVIVDLQTGEAGRVFGPASSGPTLFGRPVPWIVATLLVLGSGAAWLALMVGRNLKRPVEDLQLLSRAQAVGFTLYVDVLLLALLDPERGRDMPPATTIQVMLTTGLAYLVGLLILAPRERLRIWWRGRPAAWWIALHEDGLPWPWLILVAVAGLLTSVLGGILGPRAPRPGADAVALAAGQMAVTTVFAVRDILFLQWCRLTGMKRPIGGGLAYLFLLMAVQGLLQASIFGAQGGHWLWLPWTILAVDLRVAGLWATVQIPVIVLLLLAIARRLARPVRPPTP